MKKYDQNKLASILARIAKETRDLIAKYAFVVAMLFPILMEGQTADTVDCITGIRVDGVCVAIYRGNEYEVKYRQGQAYFVVGEKFVFIKPRKTDVITK